LGACSALKIIFGPKIKKNLIDVNSNNNNNNNNIININNNNINNNNNNIININNNNINNNNNNNNIININQYLNLKKWFSTSDLVQSAKTFSAQTRIIVFF
jgi:hypothetical protein